MYSLIFISLCALVMAADPKTTPGPVPAQVPSQKPPVRSNIGQQPPVRGDIGQQPPVRGDIGQQPPVRSDIGQQPPVRSDIGQQPPLRGDIGLDSSSISQEGSSEEYRQLEQDEVKSLLLKVIDENVDKDKDHVVTVEELQEWLRVLQERVIQDNVERQWAYYNAESDPDDDGLSWRTYYPEKKEAVSWEKYKNMTYPDEALLEEEPSTEELKEIKAMIARAERRWKNADADGDGSLSKEEFRDYIHPEESQKAAGVVVLEAMEDMDLDKNKEISMDEYMNHLQKVSGPEKEDPSWAVAQQGHFQNYLDKDKDGSLSESEMREWVIPSYDRSEAEAWRLISVADADQDSKLSREDIATYHEYFLTLLPPEYWVQEDPTESSRHDEF